MPGWSKMNKEQKKKPKQFTVPSLIPILKLLRDHFGVRIISGDV